MEENNSMENPVEEILETEPTPDEAPSEESAESNEEQAPPKKPLAKRLDLKRFGSLPAKIAFFIVGGLTLVSLALFLFTRLKYYPAGLMLTNAVNNTASYVYSNIGGASLNVFSAAFFLNAVLGVAYIAIGILYSSKRSVIGLIGAGLYAVDTMQVVLSISSNWLYVFDLVIHLAVIALLCAGLAGVFSNTETAPEPPAAELEEAPPVSLDAD